ncbi:MAG: hypothetical protein NT038_02435 [Euryarchaeota archaeon]|nr:hypothetical protein [Euryarchaeota archaeon]
MNKKTIIIYSFAFILLLCMIVLFHSLTNTIKQPEQKNYSFSETLWNTWGLTIIIAAFIIFASGAGILALLGGAWGWE